MGLEYARQLGARGYDLVLVSNRPDELETAAKELSLDGKISVNTCFMDLSAPGAAEGLLDWCDGRGITVDVLVNNAGMFFMKYLSPEILPKVRTMEALHMGVITDLCILFGTRMKERGSGRILNVSSMTARIPAPGIAIYSATKAYLKSFGKSFSYEMRPFGVTVTTVCPAAVDTPLYPISPRWRKFLKAVGFIKSPQYVVRRALRAMFHGRRVLSPAFMNTWLPPLVAMLPSRLIDFLGLKWIAALVAVLLLPGLSASAGTPQLREDNIKEVIAAMTPQEKCILLVGGRAAKAFNGIGLTEKGVPGAAGTVNGIPRLGIPQIVLADGPAGLRISPVREPESRTYYCTGFPIATMLASTWNPELVEQVGRAMGNEVLEYGVDVLLAPGANIHRNPLCGRNFEYYSEDPLLSGSMAAAMINGVQSNGVGTSLKHFALNNQELNRLANNAIVSERALREIYLRNFEIAVRKAQPWTIMTSYNYINGVHAAENHDILTDMLRGEWGFEGAVMTDWGGGYDVPGMIRAGNDMIQPGSESRYNILLESVKDGTLSMEDLDACVERVLKLIVKSPKFRGYQPSEAPDLQAHAKICKQAADEGVILLENHRALPIPAGTKIALFGVTSYDFIAGGTGSGDVHRPYVVDLKEGLANAGFTLDSPVDSFYTVFMALEKMRCKRINADSPWYIDRERAIEAVPVELIERSALTADAAVITFGRVFGEGKDRDYYHSYLLSAREQELLQRVSKAFHAQGKQVTVILNIGGLVEMASWKDLADAVLLCWQPGEEGGNTVASVLSGQVNPSGRLPMTVSVSYDREPSAGNFPQVFADKPFNYSFYRQIKGHPYHTVKDIDYTLYDEGIYVGYRHFCTFDPKGVLYPFGYGMSYTSFSWSGMKVDQTPDGWTVRVDVANTGKAAGKDVVELYVKAPGKDMDKPARELRGFAKTPLLAPGESCEVEISLSRDQLASFNEKTSSWQVEKGRYTFIAARDAADKSLRKKVRVR